MVNVIVSSAGVQGPRGNAVLTGSGAPASNVGIDGDYYINTAAYPASAVLYGPRAAGAWPGTGITLVSLSGVLQAVNNLSDVASTATARANLGLGGAATLNVGTGAGTVAAGNDSRITGAIQSGAATGGDLTGTLPAALTVSKIQGQAISAPPGTTTQYLRADGTWVNPNSPVINVRDYGAKGDGSTNDTTAINSAITALGSGTGTLYIPPGTYVTTGLLLQSLSGFTVRGERGSIVTLAGNTVGAPNQGAANVLTIADCTDFAIEGLSIDGRRDTLFPLTVLAANATSGQASVQVAHGASAAYVVGQRLNLLGGLTANGGNEANQQDQQLVIQSITPGGGSSNDTITFTTNLANNYTSAAGTLSDGYGPYAAGGAYVTPWQTGNATVAGRGLAQEDQQNGIHLINCHRFRLSGCNIHNVWESPIRHGTHNLTGTSQTDGCSYGTITGNTLWHGYDQGVGLWCSSNMTVTGNVISAAGWAGICLTLGDDSTISGNVVSDNVQRIPNDTKAGYGIAIEGGVRNTVTGNKAQNNYASQIYLTAGGTLPFGGPAQVATTVASGSNAVTLPTGTINVGSTTGFATAGQFTVLSSAGAQQVTYTGVTGTSFTGCTGGVGTLYTGVKVAQYPVFTNNGAALAVASSSTTVSDGTRFQVGGHYTIMDGPKSERVDVLSIASNVVTFTKPTAFYHPDKVQFSQSVCEDNTIVGNSLSGGNDVGIKLASAIRTTIYGNVINRAGLRGIDLIGWSFGGLQPPYGTVVSGNTITAPDNVGDGSSYQAIAAGQVSDLQIVNNRCGGAPSTQGYFNAVFLQAVTDSVVSGNVVADAYAVGLRLDTVNEWVCKRVLVSNNEILRCFGEGMLLWGGDSLNVKNNIIVGCASNNGPGGFGGALDIRGVTNSQLSDNLVINNGHGGIGLDSATIQGSTVNCTGNILAGNIARDDGLNYDAFNGAHTQQGSGIKELSGGQGPNTYINNLVSGNITNWGITSTGNTLRGNQNYNPVGKFGAQPAVPASGTPYTNTLNADATAYITGGTVTAISIGGQATGLVTPATVRVQAGQAITLTYSAAPTWTWFGD